MRLIRFPAFRQHEAARIRAHDAMIALRVAARITEAELASVDDRSAMLPMIYPGVPDIERLNRSVEDAMEIIATAEQDFAFMALPYLLSTHHAFVCACITMLSSAEAQDRQVPDLEGAHRAFEEVADHKLPEDLVGLFQLVRHLRNRILHAGGTQGSHTREKWFELPADAREGWTTVAGRPLVLGGSSSSLALAFGEVVACMMIVTRLGQEINRAMLPAVSREAWAQIAVRDYRQTYPAHFAQQSRRHRRCTGYAREMYGPVELTEREVAEALDQETLAPQ